MAAMFTGLQNSIAYVHRVSTKHEQELNNRMISHYFASKYVRYASLACPSVTMIPILGMLGLPPLAGDNETSLISLMAALISVEGPLSYFIASTAA